MQQVKKFTGDKDYMKYLGDKLVPISIYHKDVLFIVPAFDIGLLSVSISARTKIVAFGSRAVELLMSVSKVMPEMECYSVDGSADKCIFLSALIPSIPLSYFAKLVSGIGVAAMSANIPVLLYMPKCQESITEIERENWFYSLSFVSDALKDNWIMQNYMRVLYKSAYTLLYKETMPWLNKDNITSNLDLNSIQGIPLRRGTLENGFDYLEANPSIAYKALLTLCKNTLPISKAEEQHFSTAMWLLNNRE